MKACDLQVLIYQTPPKLQVRDLILSYSVKGSRLKVQSHPLGRGSRHHQKCVSLPRRNPKQTFLFNLPHKTNTGGQLLGQDTLHPYLPFIVHTCRQMQALCRSINGLLLEYMARARHPPSFIWDSSIHDMLNLFWKLATPLSEGGDPLEIHSS